MHKRNRPHLVTGAAISREDEHRARQRRYALTMSLRVVLLIAAALIARHSMVLAIVVGVLSAVLPWIAVVMANDRPPKNSRRARRVTPGRGAERALTAGDGTTPDRRVISADQVIIDENGATLRPKERGDHEQQ
ncbi:DUF3099 domain-containing protein [Cumulibacter manganitolerans]|uniref:DUF3099 domain-containing protein n=1 Tax=Cumulibacter manganitolerans TaxID=1884992 RepID=UPI001E33F9CC|nr:DUF3099 domain-containing protein [Cumulibacter manganitolerans]